MNIWGAGKKFVQICDITNFYQLPKYYFKPYSLTSKCFSGAVGGPIKEKEQRKYIQGYYIQDIYPITGYMIWIYILLPKWIKDLDIYPKICNFIISYPYPK